MSRDKWKIIGKSDDCGRCKIPAAAKHPVTSVGCVCKYLPVAARLREPIRGEAGDSGDASATPAADRSSGRIRMCPPGSGCCSAKSPRYGVISNSGTKRDCCDLRYGGRSLTLHVIKLEWLDAGDEPVFFDLFRNGKRYLLIHDFGGSNYGPYHLRVIEFDADGWRQIYYGPTGEIPRLDDVNGDGRFEFRHFDDFSTPLATMNPCGVLVLAYSNGKLMPDRELNKKVPMTSEDLSALAEKYKKFIHEFGYASSDNGEDVKAYFVKETLIDLLYGGNWHQCDQVIQYLKYDPASGEQLKTKILEEVQKSPYYVFISNLNRH